MIDLSEAQKEVLSDKIRQEYLNPGITKEFCSTYGELAEAYQAYLCGGDVGGKLADVTIHLLGIATLLDLDLETAITSKIKINRQDKHSVEL